VIKDTTFHGSYMSFAEFLKTEVSKELHTEIVGIPHVCVI